MWTIGLSNIRDSHTNNGYRDVNILRWEKNNNYKMLMQKPKGTAVWAYLGWNVSTVLLSKAEVSLCRPVEYVYVLTE